MRARLILASIALMLVSPAASANNASNPICLPDLSDGQALILIAEAGESAIVSRTATSIRFKPGYQVRIVKRGGRTLALVSTPGVSKGTGTVDCSCSSGGACFPTLGPGPSVVCTSSNCNSCTIKLTTPPPPVPEP